MSSLWPIFVALIPLLIAVAGGLWGLYQWLDSQKTAEVSRSIEARQPFLKLQLERYQEAAHTVGQLATTNVANFDKDRWDKLEIRFWELFNRTFNG